MIGPNQPTRVDYSLRINGAPSKWNCWSSIAAGVAKATGMPGFALDLMGARPASGREAEVMGEAAEIRRNAATIRAEIRNDVAVIEPLDELEKTHRAEALAWIDSGAPLCRTAKPATPPKHLVSYFAVVDEGSILLVDHRNAELWLPAGGHVEMGEHPRETVVRELFEELKVVPKHEIAEPLMVTCTATVGLTAGHLDVSLWYVVRIDRTPIVDFDREEFAGIQWFEFADVPLPRSDPHMGRFLAKLAAQNAGSGRLITR
jgi:8-oxo-dGTP diphosphatase